MDRNAKLVNQLEDAGAIIIGKSNMNELCNWKGVVPANGLSAAGGQTQSAYVTGGFNPNDGSMGHSSTCGSSSGSAVGVSAGYSILSESFGSLVSPATRAALYCIKPTIGTTLVDGIWTLSPTFDAVGGMTRSVADLANITDILQDAHALKKRGNYRQYLTKTFDGLKIGFLDPAVWHFSPEKCMTTEAIKDQMDTAYFAAMKSIGEQAGINITYPISLPDTSKLSLNGVDTISTIVDNQYEHHISEFLKDVKNSPIHSIQDMIDFNRQNSTEELPHGEASHQRLVQVANDPPSDEAAAEAFAHMLRVSRDEGVDKAFDEHGLNLLAFPMDSWVVMLAAAAGYPIATMPLGVLDFHGRPFGLGILAQAGREDLMFQFMSAFEKHFPPRQIPRRLLSSDDLDYRTFLTEDST